MPVTSVLSDDTLIISISGAFDFSVVHEFRESYSEIDIKKVKVKVKVDFRDTIHLDSSALGMLLNLKRHFEAEDKDVKILNARRDVKKILSIAHFEKAFDIS